MSVTETPSLSSGLTTELPATSAPLRRNNTLLDCLTIERWTSAFFEYVRGVRDVLGRLDNADLLTTIIAPSNTSLSKMDRRPHVRHDLPTTPTESQPHSTEEDLSGRQVERFVYAHVIPYFVHLPSLTASISTAADHSSKQFTCSTLLADHHVTFRPETVTPDGADSSTGPATSLTAPIGWIVDPGGARVVNVKEVSNGLLIVIDGTIDCT